MTLDATCTSAPAEASLPEAPPARPLRIVYFVHDLSDPAVERRVRMLTLGGAELALFGFRRSKTAPAELGGAPVVGDLGRTYDSRFLHRAAAAGLRALASGKLAEQARSADLLLARNLEMLAIAAAVRARLGHRPPLVYECLDIHRLMVTRGPAGAAMRLAERRLMDRTRTLIVSSPAFLSAYFEPVQGIGRSGHPRPLLIENRLLEEGLPPPRPAPRPPGPPWRILWPGIIRCRKSLEVLGALAARRPDLLQVVIRGRPTLAVFPDLAAEVADLPGVVYGGPFEPEEVPQLYADTHFTWAVDFFDEGRNSSWLLPNRLYQGGYYGSVPIGDRRVEIGRWLERNGLGAPLDDPERDLEAFLDGLTPEAYRRLEAASLTAPASLFSAGPEACRALVRTLQAG